MSRRGKPAGAGAWRLLGAVAWALATLALVGYLLIYLAHARVLIDYPFDFDQGEGYDLWSGWLLSQGQPIYTSNEEWPYYSSNYPPVFSLALVPIVSQTGPWIGAGRLLSASAALVTAVIIGLAVYGRTRHGLAAVTAGLLYIASSYVFHTTPLSRVNALAVMFAVAGVAASRPTGAWPALAVGLFLLALFTKQTMIDAAAAGMFAMFLANRQVGVLWALLLGLLGGLAWIGLDVMHSGQFFVNVMLGNVNPFSVSQAVAYYRNFIETHGVMLALAGCAWWYAWRRRELGPFEWYWIASLGLAVTVGKWGAGESYFLAPIAASSVLAGLTLARAHDGVHRHEALFALAASVLLLHGVLVAHGPLHAWAPFLADRGAQASALGLEPGPEDVRIGMNLVHEIRRFDGPILAEDPGFAIAAGREVVGNATHLRNLHGAGVWRGERLLADLNARRFRWVVLDAELYPEPVLMTVGRTYYLSDEYAVNGAKQKLFAPGAR
jgi:hypothetical protein